MAIATPHPTDTPDFSAVKQKQQATWSAGHYSQVGNRILITAEQLAEQLALHAGERVLDVCAGSGNFALAAARRAAEVTACDYVDNLLADARLRANSEHLPLATQPADVENLPFDAGEFDVVASTFGAMFAPDHARSAAEIARVCRSGGRIGLANWAPDGFIGRVLKLVGGRMPPPPPGLQPPPLWGTEAHLESLFAQTASAFDHRREHYVFCSPSAEDWLDFMQQYYGPTNRAFAAISQADGQALRQDIAALIAELNTARDGSMRVPSAYLSTVITRR